MQMTFARPKAVETNAVSTSTAAKMRQKRFIDTSGTYQRTSSEAISQAGVTPLFAKGATEWDTDLLFKKPWDISRKMEFMLGVGPAWVHTNKSGATRNSISGEVAPDFMFWPSAKRRFGWYIEPSYEYNFARGHEQSIGVTVGLLISIR